MTMLAAGCRCTIPTIPPESFCAAGAILGATFVEDGSPADPGLAVLLAAVLVGFESPTFDVTGFLATGAVLDLTALWVCRGVSISETLLATLEPDELANLRLLAIAAIALSLR